MNQLNSVSEGCFIFKSKKRKTKNSGGKGISIVTSFLNETDRNEMWYKAFKNTWTRLENEIKSIQTEEISHICNELIEFVDRDNSDVETLLPIAVLLTGINQNDHYDEFSNLSKKLKSTMNFDVVTLQSRDCPNLKTAFEKLVANFVEATTSDNSIGEKLYRRSEYTMKMLESRYNDIQTENTDGTKRKLLIILPDFELFNVEIFKKILIVLISYRRKIPISVVIGVATSLSALRNSLPYHVLNKSNLKVFRNEPSANKLNKIVECVLLSPFCPFHFSGEAFQFLIDIFLFYDFSVNSFVQGIKHCIIEHYTQGSIFSLCSFKETAKTHIHDFTESDLTQIRHLPSCRRYLNDDSSQNIIGFFLSDTFLRKYIYKFLKKNETYWYNFYCGLDILQIFVKNLPEHYFGKNLRNLYIFCTTKNLVTTLEYTKTVNLVKMISRDEFIIMLNEIIESLEKYISTMRQNLKHSRKYTFTYQDIANRLTEFKLNINTISNSRLTERDSKTQLGSSPVASNKPLTNRNEFKEMLLQNSMKKASSKNEISQIIENTVRFIDENVFRKFLLPLSQGPPLIELNTFTNIASIKRHIIGTPRSAIHTALNNPNHYLMCQCCMLKDLGTITPSLPDLSIAYKLYLESGKLINLFDWLQSFRSIVDNSEDEACVDPKIQARFTRAVSELEHLGFIKTTKKKTDHVSKLTW